MPTSIGYHIGIPPLPLQVILRKDYIADEPLTPAFQGQSLSTQAYSSRAMVAAVLDMIPYAHGVAKQFVSDCLRNCHGFQITAKLNPPVSASRGGQDLQLVGAVLAFAWETEIASK